MKKIKIKGLELNNKSSHIAVPITGKNIAEIKKQLLNINADDIDMIEFRIDFLDKVDKENVITAKKIINEQFPQIPLLATIRTNSEGGNFSGNDDEYLNALLMLSQIQFDLIDAEISRSNVESVINKIKTNHQLIIGSYHNFDQTPTNEFLMQTWTKMQTLGCNIAKIAVMPNDINDVLRFMQISHEADQKLSIPIISMEMGQLGMLTRLSGMLTGSIITFGSTSKRTASAPGQIDSHLLKQILEVTSLN